MDLDQPPKKKSRFFHDDTRSHDHSGPSCSQNVQGHDQSTALQHIDSSTHLAQQAQTNSAQQTHASHLENSHSGSSVQSSPSARYSIFENLHVRDRRRDGVYGVQSLLPAPAQPAAYTHPHDASPSPSDQSVSHSLIPRYQSFDTLTSHLPLPPVPITAYHPERGALQQPQGHNLLSDTLDRTTNVKQNPRSATHQTITHPTREYTTPHTLRDKSYASQYVDLDRDATGRLVSHCFRSPTAGVSMRNDKIGNNSCQPPTKRVCSPQTPANLLTSPNRIRHAEAAARDALKRKRPFPVLPPPAYIYARTNAREFNIFQGILLYPELVFALAAQLPIESLVSLYAISRDFHTIIDTRFTTVVLSQSIAKAPQSSRTFTFRCYAALCREDPAARIPHPDPSKQTKVRLIPSFRWLRMVLYREKVVHEIMAIFAEDGVPLPARCSLAVKRLWFLLDIPDNARRVGWIHIKQLFTDLDLYFAMCFFVKLDMRFNDPVGAEKRDGLRKMLLSQRSFSTLHRVLKRETWQTRHDVLREWVKWKYELAPDEQDTTSVFGVPKDEIGKLKLEYWGMGRHANGSPLRMLLRPDQLVMREAVRRGLRFTKHFLRCILYGYIRPDTLEDYEPRNYERRIASLKDEEYEADDVVGNVAPLAIEEGGDVLLDRGSKREASILTSTPERLTQEELEKRKNLDEFIKRCMAWSEEEQADLAQDEGMEAEI